MLSLKEDRITIRANHAGKWQKFWDDIQKSLVDTTKTGRKSIEKFLFFFIFLKNG